MTKSQRACIEKYTSYFKQTRMFEESHENRNDKNHQFLNEDMQ